MYVRAKKTGSAGLKIYYYWPSTEYYSSNFLLTTSFADYSYTWSVNPNGSATWSGLVDIMNGRWGIESVIPRGRGQQTSVSAVWLVVDYTLPAGYSNDVIGVASGDIAKVNGIATADISKVNGV